MLPKPFLEVQTLDGLGEVSFMNQSSLSTKTSIKERQTTYLIGAQPVLESFDVFWYSCTFPVEIAQGMSKYVYMSRQERQKGAEQQESQNTSPQRKP